MKTIQNSLIAASLFFTLTIVGCSSHEEGKSITKMEPITVETIEVASSNTANGFSVSGNIQPKKEANISTRIMGYITGINAEVGDRISKGEVLVNISNSDLQAKLAQVKANIAQAEAGLQNAKKDLDRMTILFGQNSVTQKELDDITTHYNMAKAGVEAAKQMENEVNAQFAYTRITAPFSGTITAKFANSGDLANPGMPLLTIAKTGDYQVVAMVPENQISAIKTGQKALIRLKSIDKEISGTVDEIAVSSSNTGGQFIVKLSLDRHDQKLYAGMYTTVSFEGSKDEKQQTLLIPESSLVQKGGLKGVYTVGSDNVAILRWLRIGRKYGVNYEVLSGLSSGDQLIVSSQSRLYNGAPLSIK
jgi:RND family efflux transporter MFP subunit